MEGGCRLFALILRNVEPYQVAQCANFKQSGIPRARPFNGLPQFGGAIRCVPAQAEVVPPHGIVRLFRQLFAQLRKVLDPLRRISERVADALPFARITSGASAASSAAYLLSASLPVDQWVSICTLLPSTQPNCCRPCWCAA